MPKKVDLSGFIKKAREIHGDAYDYSSSSYVKARTPMIIICNTHGEFHQTPHNHLLGKGCPKCGIISRTIKRRTALGDFINKAVKIHNGRYDYSRVVYLRTHDKVEIVCPVHGSFWQRPSGHLRGLGCYQCTHESLDVDIFVKRSRNIHGDKYDYSHVEYSGAKSLVNIICPLHGEFQQLAHSHSKLGAGCLKCSNNGPSRAECDVFDFVKSLCHDAHQSDREIISPKELDIVIPSKRVAIEFNGLHWHSDRTKDKRYHIDKRLAVEAAGYRLISIREDLWNERRVQIESIIRNALGESEQSVYARKCDIVTVTPQDAKTFMDNNHIQSFRGATYHYGLSHGSEIVAVMSVTHWKNKDTWELIRYATSCNVAGGLGKLWKHVTRSHSVVSAYSYVDRDLFTGTSYSHAGFTLDATTVGFRIVNGATTESRQQWNKAPHGMTQSEWYESENVARIYDSGQDKLIYRGKS